MTELVNQADLDVFLEILTVPPLFEVHEKVDDEKECRLILNELSDAEVLETANVSYAFWYVSSKFSEQLPPDARDNSAVKEIRRHYVGEGRRQEKAIMALKEALQHRKTYHANVLRSCFDSTNTGANSATNDDNDQAAANHRAQCLVREDLERQRMVVRGSTRSSSAIAFKAPRESLTSNDEDEAYIATQIYSAERCIAATEFLSQGRVEKTFVLLSFEDYSSKNVASRNAMMVSISTLQRMYPERLQNLVVLGAPFWMRALFTLCYPLMGETTRAKMQFVSGQEDVQKVIGGMVDDQKVIDLLQAGEFSSSMDVRHYLSGVPLHRLYDDFPLEKIAK